MPVLLFVTALIVNYGTAAAWRVRAEVNSRDAGARTITPRTGRNEPRPENFPMRQSRLYTSTDPLQITELDDPSIDLPVVRGPIPDFNVFDTLDPDSRGLERGTSEIDRDYPMLPAIGQFNSGLDRTHSLDDSWAISRMFFTGVIPIPNEDLFNSASWEDSAGFSVGGIHRFSTIRNIYRRTKLIYELPRTGRGSANSYASAYNDLRRSSTRTAMRVLDADEDFIRYRGSAPDFYPRARIICELDPEIVRERSLERVVIDYLDIRGNVQLGGVTQLPRRLTSAFLGLYYAELRRLMNDPTAAGQRAELERKISQLEQYQKRLPDIEDRLRQSSTAR